MSQHFSQKDIDAYREAFYLYAQNGTVENEGHLCYIMRVLGHSPTVEESKAYFKKSNKKIDFAGFLNILHEHSGKEKPYREVMAAFRSHDRARTGTIPAKELKSLLTGMGEKLSPQQVDQIYKEFNIRPNGQVAYEDFVKALLAPIPQHY